MTPLEAVLALAVLVLTIVVALLVLRRTDDGAEPIDERAVRESVGSAIAELALDATAGQIETHAREMKAVHTDLERLLGTPAHRGAFGEVQLETILRDQLPPELYGTQEAILGNLRPDAYVETAEGIVPIDAKFPLERYEAALEAPEGSDERRRHERGFARAVERQLEKIRVDYVRPEDGTTEFAFAFIPSESVYYYLVREEYDLLREYASAGVQLVSPLTLGHKLELLKAGVHARRLSARAEEVQDELHRLGRRFDVFEDDWSTFMRHVTNAKNKADDADARLADLRAEFDRIDGLSPDEGEPGVDGRDERRDGTPRVED